MLELPQTIDHPPMFLLWRMDDLVPFVVVIVFGVLMSQLLLSILIVFLALRLYRKYRERRADGHALHWFYWHGLLPLKARTTPNPFCRRWVP